MLSTRIIELSGSELGLQRFVLFLGMEDFIMEADFLTVTLNRGRICFLIEVEDWE